MWPDGSASPTLRRRVEAALRAGGPGTIFIPTGGRGRHGPAEASVMGALLEAGGVPAERIRPEPTATDTLSSVLACGRLLRAAGHRGEVHLATSGYHLPRCLLLVRLAGWPARPVPPPRGVTAAWRKRWWWRLREVPALPYDAGLLVWARLAGRAR